MLKYYDIINRLSDSEKIRILCDITCLSEKNYRAFGIPELRIESLEKLCKNEYPSPESLANTWDTELVEQVADDLFKRASAQEVGFVSTPAPRVKINPYRTAISEDPLLATRMSQAYIDAAQKAGIAVGLSDFGLYHDEIEWLDHTPDDRLIHEFIVKPYMNATQNKHCAAILTEENVANSEYSTVNTKLMTMVLNNRVADGATPICTHVSTENTVTHLISGGLFFEGSALAVESALSNHKKLVQDIAHGLSTTEELNDEISKGKAISPEMLDSAVDRMLDFVFTAKRKPTISTVSVEEDLSLKATEKATVLLKNQNKALPLRKGTKIGMIGDIALCLQENNAFVSQLKEHLKQFDISTVGVERGYDLATDRNETLVSAALDLAKASDIVLLFLGIPENAAKKMHRSKQLTIPANQQELLDRLEAYKQKVIAILPSDTTTDICIPENCRAIMLSPIKAKNSAAALSRILSGRTNPSGRLAGTVYCNTDHHYVTYKTYRERDHMKAGTFIGYRYYDTAEDVHAFPFGHGLSYTRITYSSLHVSHRKVRLTLKNNGALSAVETVQVYLGKDDSAVIRPKKELCGFARVALKAGEKKTVEIPVEIPCVFDAANSVFVQEAGRYHVYVGASVSDIMLQSTMVVDGNTLACDHKNISDYIHSRSNIHTDNYKLEAKIKAMKKSVFNIAAGAGTLVLAIMLKLFCVAKDLSFYFFDWFAVALAILGIAFFVAEAVRRNKIRAEEQQTVDKLNSESFEEAEQIPIYSAEKMFVNEFDTAPKTTEEENGDKIEGVASEYLQYIDKEQNFELAAAEFEIYAAQRGCKFRPDVTKKVFAALASSRLLVIDGMSSEQLTTFMKMLCGYMKTGVYIDRANEAYTGIDGVLFKLDQQGNKRKTNLNLSMDFARKTPSNIHFATLTNVTCASLPAYFTPFLSYVKNPLANNQVVALNEKNTETSYHIPQNVWFVLHLAEGERGINLPTFVSEVATVNRFDFEDCAVSEQTSEVRNFSYYQMDYLAERASNIMTVDEDVWKRVDRLEEFVSSHTPFRIGNKLWLGLERFAYVYLACDGDKMMAVDEALAAKLMVPALTALQGKLSQEDMSLSETVESILGEDRAEACKRVIRACTDHQA